VDGSLRREWLSASTNQGFDSVLDSRGAARNDHMNDEQSGAGADKAAETTLSRDSVSSTDFWELLHTALGLQHEASGLAEAGRSEEAAACERQAMSLLLEATCLLDPRQPALDTVRQLATAGLARLHSLKRPRKTSRARPRGASTAHPPARTRSARPTKRQHAAQPPVETKPVAKKPSRRKRANSGA
jgi:hypothetical protein